jgi:hypothetical protein
MILTGLKSRRSLSGLILLTLALAALGLGQTPSHVAYTMHLVALDY